MSQKELPSEGLADSRHDQQPVDVPAFNSPQTKLVYLYLYRVPDASIDDLEGDLGIDKLTLYPLLRLLIDREFVERHDQRYVHSTESEE